MITIPSELDLGRDQTRMKGGLDAQRQKVTVEELLRRMYPDSSETKASQLQLVADEVGMGKTFVALGLAYSVLSALRDKTLSGDFDGCVPQVLVIAPQNSALVEKWKREISEFVRRCIAPENRDDASKLFSLEVVERTDDLVKAMKRRESGIVITHMGVLSGGKRLLHYDLKRRVLMGALFRFWGNKFGLDDRARLLKGAPEGWPSKSNELGQISDDEIERLPFADESELLSWLRKLKEAEQGCEELEDLLEACREIAQPHTRGRSERFEKVETALNKLYKSACFAGIEKPLPLVIVDEAHNWKNGPRAKSNGYGGFENHIAPLTRRLLMLTATPFQLRPQEILELVRAGEVIAPSGEPTGCEERRQSLRKLRESVIGKVLENSASRSVAFSKSWARLSPKWAGELAEVWASDLLCKTRSELFELANVEGVVHEASAHAIIADAALRVLSAAVRDRGNGWDVVSLRRGVAGAA